MKASCRGTFSIGRDGSMVCTCTPLVDNEYGLVSVLNKRLYCFICHRECQHAHHVEELIESEYCPESLEELSVLMKFPTNKDYKATSPDGISWKKVPFMLTESQQSIMRKGYFSFLSPDAMADELVFPSPVELQLCPTCCSVFEKESVSLPVIFEKSIHKGLGKVLYSYYGT